MLGVRLGQHRLQFLHPAERQRERARLEDQPGVAQLRDLVGGQRRCDPVAAQGRASHQPGTLEMHQGLTHRSGGDRQLAGEPVDAERGFG